MAYKSILGRSFGKFAAGGGAQQGAMNGEMMATQQAMGEAQLMEMQRKAQAEERTRMDAEAAKGEQLAAPTIRRLMMAAGQVPTDQDVADTTTFMQTGQAPQKFDPNAGPAMPAPWGDKKQLGMLAQRFAAVTGARAGDFKSPEDLFKAMGTQAETNYGAQVYGGNDPTAVAQFNSKNPEQVSRSRLFEDIRSGKITPQQGAEIVGAIEGNGAYGADGSGMVFNKITGAVDNRSPLAQATIEQRRAAAERDRRPASAGKSIVRDTADGLMMIDPSTGAATPVMDENGQPMRGKATDKPMTEGQAKANLFGTRMQEADKIITELEGKYSQTAINAVSGAESIPIIGGILGMAGNAMLPKEAQQAEQAQRDFINAVLRRESGAVISDSEFASARKQYFPQPGNDKDVIAQKARARQTAIQGLLAEVPDGKRLNVQPQAPSVSASGLQTSPTRVSPGDQRSMDSDRVKVIQNEYANAKDPQLKQALARELQKLGAPVPAAPAAPAAGGWTYIGKE